MNLLRSLLLFSITFFHQMTASYSSISSFSSFSSPSVEKPRTINMNSYRRKQIQRLHQVDSEAGKMYHEVLLHVTPLNLLQLETELMTRSDPTHQKYQEWMTFDEIGALTQNHDGTARVKAWLTENIDVQILWESPLGDYLKAIAPINTWARLFKTQFHVWEENIHVSKQSRRHVRAENYTIPACLSDSLSAVFKIVDVPIYLTKSTQIREQPNQNSEMVSETTYLRGDEKNQAVTLQSGSFPAVTVAFLNAFYRINSNVGSRRITQVVYETNNQHFSQQDLRLFQQKYGLVQLPAIDQSGGQWTTNNCGQKGFDCSESNLDLQYIMGVAGNTTTIFWYDNGADPLVSWIANVASSKNPPAVLSISYGTVEQAIDASIMASWNTQAAKLSLMGTTIVASSGDNGAPNVYGGSSSLQPPCQCDSDSSSQASLWTGVGWGGKGYFPSFPASSPYVVAVGGTQMPDPQPLLTTTFTEQACQSDTGGVITSGGGFSTYWATPKWQTKAVSSYFSKVNAATLSPGFNANGRGIPDISLIAVDYVPIVGGTSNSFAYGTSASAPVFAAFVSLVNAARKKQGRGTVGYILPTLYAYAATNASLFNDVGSGGNNKCCAMTTSKTLPMCCTSGFLTSAGWDPVTGLGSINYDSFAKIFSVTSPYTTTNDDQSGSYHPNPILPPSFTGISQYFNTPTNIAIIVVVILALICIPTGYCIYRKRLQRRNEQLQDQNQQQMEAIARGQAGFHDHNPNSNQPTRATVVALPSHIQAMSTSPYRPQRQQQQHLPPNTTLPPIRGGYASPSAPPPAAVPAFAPGSHHIETTSTAAGMTSEQQRASRERDILLLTEMGFPFAAAERALSSCNWNRERAVEMLTSGPSDTHRL